MDAPAFQKTWTTPPERRLLQGNHEKSIVSTSHIEQSVYSSDIIYTEQPVRGKITQITTEHTPSFTIQDGVRPLTVICDFESAYSFLKTLSKRSWVYVTKYCIIDDPRKIRITNPDHVIHKNHTDVKTAIDTLITSDASTKSRVEPYELKQRLNHITTKFNESSYNSVISNIYCNSELGEWQVNAKITFADEPTPWDLQKLATIAFKHGETIYSIKRNTVKFNPHVHDYDYIQEKQEAEPDTHNRHQYIKEQDTYEQFKPHLSNTPSLKTLHRMDNIQPITPTTFYAFSENNTRWTVTQDTEFIDTFIVSHTNHTNDNLSYTTTLKTTSILKDLKPIMRQYDRKTNSNSYFTNNDCSTNNI